MTDTAILLQQLTIAEKAALLEGYQSWMTNAIPRLGIPAIHLTDGPLGVRKKADTEGSGSLGLGHSLPSTAFPAGVNLANSWSPEAVETVGAAIGAECAAYDVQVLLGPGVNLKRDPRCGRNFEYYSEDPLLAGRTAAAFVRGVQSTGTAACPKHFALNNCENFRYMSDSLADERAARELYLKAFEICVKEGRPKTLMCSYNKVDGEFASQNRWLLTDLLREQWGFDGLVMSDWGAVQDRVKGVAAGLDLDMPGGQWANRRAIIDAAENGTLSMDVLDRAVGRVLELIRNTQQSPENMDVLLKAHAETVIDLACESAVLLENDGILPLSTGTKLHIVGELFDAMRYQGAGSSGLNPAYLVTPRMAFEAADVPHSYTQGYRAVDAASDTDLEAEALAGAQKADIVLFFGGLTELTESEGYDRDDLSLPANQLQLLNKLLATGKPVVAVLFGGAPFEVPFTGRCAAILHMFLPGQGGGEACRRLLWGEASPGGKLSETWVRSCRDLPFAKEFGKHRNVCYKESIYTGYRYFDMVPEAVSYPFGHGLSYTAFTYHDLQITHDGTQITATVTVTNSGSRAGSEVVQLYAGKNPGGRVFKAAKELRAFCKVHLQPGESRTVQLTFTETDLAYYHAGIHRWVTENGEYPIYVGASSRDIRLTGSATVSGYPEEAAPYTAEVICAYSSMDWRRGAHFEALLGHSVPVEQATLPLTVESPISDYQQTVIGRFLLRCITGYMKWDGRKIKKLPDGPEKTERLKNQQFILRLIPQNSARSLVQSSGGFVQMHLAYAITEFANGRLFRALKHLKTEKALPLPCDETK